MANQGMALLAQLSNAIAATVNPTEKQMSRDEIVSYVNGEVIAMVKDTPDVAKQRLAALEKVVADAKKAKPGETIRVKVFTIPETANPDPQTKEQDPPKSSERGSEQGKGTAAPTAKNGFATAVAELDALLGRAAGTSANAGAGTTDTAAGTSANAASSDGTPEQGKAFPPAGGGGGSGTPPKDKEDEEEDDELLAMGKQRRRALKRSDLVAVDENNPSDLFPDNMNDLRRSRSGKNYRERRPWGDDPAAVRSNG